MALELRGHDLMVSVSAESACVTPAHKSSRGSLLPLTYKASEGFYIQTLS